MVGTSARIAAWTAAAIVAAACRAPAPGPAPAPTPGIEAQRAARDRAGLVPEEFALADGAHLAVERRGTAPARWVLAGAGWLVPDALDGFPDDAPLVALDGRGRAGYATPPGRTHLDQDVRDLVEWLAAERERGAPPLRILAHGYTAVVAALAAVEVPEDIAALALVAPLPPRRDPWLARFEAAVEERAGHARPRGASPTTDPARLEAALLAPRFFDPALARMVRADPFLAGPGARATMAERASAALRELGDWDLGPRLARVTSPTWVLHGAGDALDEDASREFARAIPAARFDVLARTGAFPWIESPAAFRAWVAAIDTAAR